MKIYKKKQNFKFFFVILIINIFLFNISIVNALEPCHTYPGGLCDEICDSDTQIESNEYACEEDGTICCLPITQAPESAPKGGSSKVVKTVSLDNPLTVGANPSQIIGLIIKSALGLIGGLALVMMVWGGFQWLTSAGNPERVKKGTSTMIWAIVGLILTLGSYVLVNTIFNFLAGSKTGG